MIYDSAMKLREYLCDGTHANLSGICQKLVAMFADCCAEDGPLLLKTFFPA